MTDLNYIDSYFKGELSAPDLQQFEQKIANDPAFAEQVAFYCSSLVTLKNELAEEKKKRFRAIYDKIKQQPAKPQSGILRRIWPYMAAAIIACIIIFIWHPLSKKESVQQLTDQYIEQKFNDLGVPMGNNEDSLLADVYSNFKEKNFTQSLQAAEQLINANPSEAYYKNLAGIVSMRLKDYDKAITYFTQIENSNLFSNPAKLYHALALIKLNRSSDENEIKKLLQEVIDQDLEGKEAAQELLESL